MFNRIGSINKLNNIKNIYKKSTLFKNFAEDTFYYNNAFSERRSFFKENSPKNFIYGDSNFQQVIKEFLTHTKKKKEIKGEMDKIVFEKFKGISFKNKLNNL
jgi:hypothetical protein